MSRRTVTFRPATPEDRDLLFAWANDPQTRANSINTGAIAYETHVAWLEASLANPARALYLALEGGREVAVLRFDRDLDESPEVAVISINIAPDSRGRGVGTAVLLDATRLARSLQIERIVAYIRPENAASLKAFGRAGYESQGREIVDGVSMRRYERGTAGG